MICLRMLDYGFEKLHVLGQERENVGMIPEDPAILLSFVNMKMRDFYKSLDELCEDMEADWHGSENS